MVAYSFKERFIAPIGVGLYPMQRIEGPPIKPKRQTIRNTIGPSGKPRRHAKPGEEVQLYYAQRNPKLCRKLGDGICTETVPVEMKVGAKRGDMAIRINGTLMVRGAAEVFARDDGFANLADMWDFWRAEHAKEHGNRAFTFTGTLIRWKPKE